MNEMIIDVQLRKCMNENLRREKLLGKKQTNTERYV